MQEWSNKIIDSPAGAIEVKVFTVGPRGKEDFPAGINLMRHESGAYFILGDGDRWFQLKEGDVICRPGVFTTKSQVVALGIDASVSSAKIVTGVPLAAGQADPPPPVAPDTPLTPVQIANLAAAKAGTKP